MSAEDAFDLVDSDTTDFRYEDTFMGIKKNKRNKIDVYPKNVHSEYRLHLYINDDERGAVITGEPTPSTAKCQPRHFTVEELLRSFVKPLESAPLIIPVLKEPSFDDSPYHADDQDIDPIKSPIFRDVFCA